MADIKQIEKRLITLEKRFDQNLKHQNQFNATAHKHVQKLEKRFGKLDKTAKKMKKVVDPRLMERNTMNLVDQALKAYDQKRGKR